MIKILNIEIILIYTILTLSCRTERTSLVRTKIITTNGIIMPTIITTGRS